MNPSLSVFPSGEGSGMTDFLASIASAPMSLTSWNGGMYRSRHFGVDPVTQRIDCDALRKTSKDSVKREPMFFPFKFTFLHKK